MPTGDDAPCHVADGCPAGGCSFLRRHHDTRWPRPGPVADVIHPDVGRRIEPFSPWPAAIQLALLPDRLPRFIQTPVDAAYGCFGSSSPSRLTFDTRPVRPAAMPPFVALREDVRFRPRRRAFDFPRGDRVWIVTFRLTRRRPKTYAFSFRPIRRSGSTVCSAWCHKFTLAGPCVTYHHNLET